MSLRVYFFRKDSISRNCMCAAIHRKYMYLNVVDDTYIMFNLPLLHAISESRIQKYGICTLQFCTQQKYSVYYYDNELA